MHPLLEKLLGKRGIKELTELKPDEKQTYDKWQGILSDGEVTVDKILSFCRSQVEIIERRWKDPMCENRERLIDQHIVYKTIIEAITSPQVARENLEKYLNSLI